METDHETESVEVSVYDGPKVELTGIVVEAMRSATEVKLGQHFAEAAFIWNDNDGLDALDSENIQTFLMRLRQSVAYAETLLSLCPLPEDDASDG